MSGGWCTPIGEIRTRSHVALAPARLVHARELDEDVSAALVHGVGVQRVMHRITLRGDIPQGITAR